MGVVVGVVSVVGNSNFLGGGAGEGLPEWWWKWWCCCWMGGRLVGLLEEGGGVGFTPDIPADCDEVTDAGGG